MGQVANILHCLGNLPFLSKIIPTIDVPGTCKDTASLVKCHIEGLKTGVAKHWKDKDYAKLHDAFVNLEQAN